MNDSGWRYSWEAWAEKSDYGPDIRQHKEERQPLYRLLLDSLRAAPGRPIRVLEVGCGTAIDCHLLAQDTRVQATALDRSIQSIQIARKIANGFPHSAKLLVGDASHLCFPDETFDLVFSQGLLEHFRNPRPLLLEQARVLKRSGSLIVDVPQTFAGFGLYSLRKQWKIRQGKWPWGWETQYSYPQLKRLGRSAGLVSADVVGYGYDGLLSLFAQPHVMIDKWPLPSRLRIAQAAKRLYLKYLRQHNEQLWAWISRRFGHWLLICIAVRFRKR